MDNGQENGNFYIIQGLYWSYRIFYRGKIGILELEKKMDTTIVYSVGVIWG